MYIRMYIFIRFLYYVYICIIVRYIYFVIKILLLCIKKLKLVINLLIDLLRIYYIDISIK